MRKCWWWWLLAGWFTQVNCLSYVEKSVLDRLLTYYDDKVRPADKRNFFAAIDPDGNTPPAVIVNVSMLTVDLELTEAWYDARLQVLQNNEKIRQQFQIPDNAKIWLPNGAPLTNFHEAESSHCQQRKITLSDTARLESACHLIVQTHCDHAKTDAEIAFVESFRCRLQFEPEDTFDVNYYLCDSCQQLAGVVPPEHFSFRGTIRTVHSSFDSFDKNLLVFSSTAQPKGDPKPKRRRVKQKDTKKNKKSVPVYQEDEEGRSGGDSEVKIGDRLVIDIFLIGSTATHYIVAAIAPAACLVFLSWISLFSQRKMIRATFQSSTFFALIVLWGNHTQAPEATKLDTWFFICLIFICIAVLESIALSCIPMPRYRTPPDKRNRSLTSLNRVIVVNNVESKNQPNGGLLVQVEQCGRRVKRCVDKERVHICFALSYPIAFVGVSLCYWLSDGM